MLKRKQTLGTILGIATAVLVTAILNPSWASASRNEATLYANATMNVFVLPSAAFSSDGYSPDSFFFSFGGGYLTGDEQAYGCIKAPLYLPDGVLLRELWTTMYDNTDSQSLIVNIRRVNHYTGFSQTIGNASSNGYSSSSTLIYPSDLDLAYNLVDNRNFSYYVTTCMLSPDLRLYSVRIYHSIPVFMPLISRE